MKKHYVNNIQFKIHANGFVWNMMGGVTEGPLLFSTNMQYSR